MKRRGFLKLVLAVAAFPAEAVAEHLARAQRRAMYRRIYREKVEEMIESWAVYTEEQFWAVPEGGTNHLTHPHLYEPGTDRLILGTYNGVPIIGSRKFGEP